MVVPLLFAYADLELIESSFPRSLEEVLREKLAVLVEVISRTL